MCSSQMETQPKLLTKLSTIELKKELMEAAQKDGNNENDKYLMYMPNKLQFFLTLSLFVFVV